MDKLNIKAYLLFVLQQILQELIMRWDSERELFTTTSYNTSKYNPLLNIQHDAGCSAASGCGLVVLVP